MKSKYKIPIFILMMISSLFAFAQTETAPAPAAQSKALLVFDTNTVLAICVAALLFVIILLAFMLKSSIDLYRDNYKQERLSGNTKATTLVVLFVLAGLSVFAQAADPAAEAVVATGAAPVTVGKFNSSMISMILGVAIVIELFAIFYLIKWIKFFTGVQAFEERKRIEMGADPSVVSRGGFAAWWQRINKFRSHKEEKDLDIGHDYDGIRELDNTTPPWFTWSFAATIVFGIFYVWYFNSSKAMNQEQEYQHAVAVANKKLEAYMASQANSVDESTVKMLDAAGVQSGATIFKSKCVVCHGPEGQGGIGPNLTDNYALHGGTINDIFKTIKYGVVDKGMQSWKAELSPMQIAEVSSFIMSLHGTNPPNPKAPQGEEFSVSDASAPAADSTAAQGDTAKVAVL